MPSNLVVYATEANVRKPVASYDPADDFASVKVAHSISSALRDAVSRGVPHPEFAVVLETREADESGKLSKAEYQRVHPVTLAPQGKAASDLDSALKQETNYYARLR